MADYSLRFKTLDTNLVHAGRPHPSVEGAVVTPIFQSANYEMGDEATYDAVRYIRLSNSPNHHVLQARLAVAESAEAALVTASGMAAISTAILSHVQAGEHVLTQRTLYGGTQSFLHQDASRLGISHTAIDIADPAGARPPRPQPRCVRRDRAGRLAPILRRCLRLVGAGRGRHASPRARRAEIRVGNTRRATTRHSAVPTPRLSSLPTRWTAVQTRLHSAFLHRHTNRAFFLSREEGV